MSLRRLLLLDDRAEPAWDPLADLFLERTQLEVVRADDQRSCEAATRAPCAVLLVVWPFGSVDAAEVIGHARRLNPAVVVAAVSGEPGADAGAFRQALAAGADIFVDARQRGGLGLWLERALARTEEQRALVQRDALILEAAGEGIYGVDLGGKTTFINPAGARMVGWDAEELLGRSQHAVLHHTRPDGTPYPVETCPIYAAFKDGAVHRVDTELFFRKDGSSFPVEYISTPIREGGALVGAVVTFQDISKRRAAEAELAAYQTALESLQGELVNALQQLLETQDMVFAGRAVAEAVAPVRDGLGRLARKLSGDDAAQHEVRLLTELMATLERLGADAAKQADAIELVDELSGATTLPMTSTSPAWVRIARGDLRQIVAQLESMCGPDATIAVERDGGTASVRILSPTITRSDVALLLVRRLVGRNAASVETVHLPGGGGFVLRLALTDPGAAPPDVP